MKSSSYQKLIEVVSGENLPTNMATWTNEQESAGGGTEYDFLIDDTFFFLIDDNYKLIIQSGVAAGWVNEQES